MNASPSLLRPGFSLSGLACFATLGLFSGCNRSAPVRQLPIPEVAVQTISARRLPLTAELPGRIAPVRIAEVRARVAGILLHRVFREGSDVKAGQVLFQIDPAPFQANLDSTRAALAKAEASFHQARLLADRYRKLLPLEGVSRQDFDNADAAARQAAADVMAAKAAVTTAQLNLGYATVTAPISGRIGAALVTEGALVGQGQATQLATIQQTNVVYFDFTQSSTDVLRLRRAVDAGKIKSIAPGTAVVNLLLDDGSVYQHPGKLLFSDITVDSSTGMVTLRAEFPNPEGLLLPGMFARGRVEQAVQDSAITVPMRAVARGADGDATTLVVGPDNKVELRNLKLGDAFGEDWIVDEGLKPGERVIVAGVQKVRPGVTVRPVPLDNSSDATKGAEASGTR